MFLRIREWAVFLLAATLAFLVELAGVFWVTQGEELVKKASSTPVGKKLKSNLDKMGKTSKPNLEENANAVDRFKNSLLTAKIAHEELCEKTSLVRSFHLCVCA